MAGIASAVKSWDHNFVWPRLTIGGGAFMAILVVIAIAVLYPLAQIIIYSFMSGAFGQETGWSSGNWHEVLTQSKTRRALVSTWTLGMTQQLISFVIAVPLAWLLARTNLPGRRFLEFGFWIGFFLPTLTIMLGWIFLLDGRQGLVNLMLRQIPFLSNFSFEIFSWWGIVFVHLVTGSIAIKVMLLGSAFRNMDSSLEEVSRVCGAGPVGTLMRIMVPLMTPMMLVVLVLGMLHSLQSFEIELVLGKAAKIDIFSTLIYEQVLQEPPEYGMASTLALVMVVAVLPLIVMQYWLASRNSHQTVNGKYSNRSSDLGSWRWPLFLIVFLLLAIMTVVPLTFVGIGTFMKLFGYFGIPNPWTTAHWNVLQDGNFLQALRNSLLIGCGAAILTVLTSAVVAYLLVRSRHPGRPVLDLLVWLPASIPGMVIGLGFFALFLESPILRPLNGTIWVLIIAVVLSTMTTGVQIAKGAFHQLGNELEEASFTVGATWFRTFGSIMLPVIGASLAVVASLTFASAMRATSLIALLANSNSRPLSLLQLGLMNTGSMGQASVIGIVMLVITVIWVLIARFVSGRSGIQESTT